MGSIKKELKKEGVKRFKKIKVGKFDNHVDKKALRKLNSVGFFKKAMKGFDEKVVEIEKNRFSQNARKAFQDMAKITDYRNF